MVPTIYLNAGIPEYNVDSYAGVGFRENVLTSLSGTRNGVTDTNAADFHASVNWGDGQWVPADIAPNTGGTVSATFLVKGSHRYDSAVLNQPVQVMVTGPDDPAGKTAETAQAHVANMPSGIPGTPPPNLTSPPPPANVVVTLNAGIPDYNVDSYTDVGFRRNVVASLSGSVNGVNDTNAADFHAYVNYGDDNQWYAAEIAPNTGGTVAATFLVKGDHVYHQARASSDPYHIVVFVMGKDGTSRSGQTARGFVDDMPSALPAVPPPQLASPPPPANVVVTLNAGIPDYDVHSYTDVGFRRNVVASLSGTVNGVTDTNAADFHAYVNYGDDSQWYPAEIAPNTGGTVAATFLVKGDHVYHQPRASSDPYHVVVFVMGKDGTSRSAETARGFVDDMPSALPGTVPPGLPALPPPANVVEFLNAGIPDYHLSLNAGDGTTPNVVASLSGMLNGVTDTNAGDFHASVNWGDDSRWYPADVVPNTSGVSATFLVRGSHPYEKPRPSNDPYPVVVYVLGPDGTSRSGETAGATVAPEPDLVAGSLYWDTNLPTDRTPNPNNDGGVDLTYRIDNVNLPEPATIGLYWSHGPIFDPATDPRAYQTLSQTSTGTYTLHVPAGALADPPFGINGADNDLFLLLVVNGDGRVAESDRGNNVTSLLAGPIEVLSPALNDTAGQLVRTVDVRVTGADITATFRPLGGALTIAQAALICGVAHFNWVQQVNDTPMQWRVTNAQTGNPEGRPFLDPAPYNRTITSGSMPGVTATFDAYGDGSGFVWNELHVVAAAPENNWYSPVVNPDPFTFLFTDAPEVPSGLNPNDHLVESFYQPGQALEFQTGLVGVTTDHQRVVLPNVTGLGFLWNSNSTFDIATRQHADGGVTFAGYFTRPLGVDEGPVNAGGVSGVQLLTVPAVNHAPAWTGGDVGLTPLPSGAPDPAGQSVTALFGGLFRDADRNAVGVAVVGVTGNGSWQYSRDGGTTWAPFGAASPASARLLTGTDLVRFVPAAGAAGPATLQAHAWDQTTGADGGTADLSTPGSTGGGTAFGTTLVTLDAARGALGFGTASLTVNEGDTATLTLTRTGGSDGAVTVSYVVSVPAGLAAKYQAAPGVDFRGDVAGTVTFATGETQKTLAFPVVADDLVEDTESFTVTLQDPTGGAALGTTATVTVSLQDTNLPSVPDATPSLATLQLAGSGFGKSTEHYRDFVTGAYRRFLNRLPDEAGLNYWVTLMQLYETSGHAQGLRQEQIEAGFLDSPEYLGRYGGVGEAWVRGIYHDLLGRDADPAGVQYWLAQLAGGAAPTQVALGFTASLERLQNRIQDTYQALLGRAADPQGLAYWVAVFQAGGTTEDINSGFVGSPEYYTKAGGAVGNPARWVREAYLDILSRPARTDELAYWLAVLKL